MGFLRLLLSPFRGAAWLHVVLFLFFFAVGTLALLFGFSLGDVDNWLDANSDLIETIGFILFRLFWGFVLLMCAAVAAVCVLEGIDGIRRRRQADATRAREESKRRFWRRDHVLPPRRETRARGGPVLPGPGLHGNGRAPDRLFRLVRRILLIRGWCGLLSAMGGRRPRELRLFMT